MFISFWDNGSDLLSNTHKSSLNNFSNPNSVNVLSELLYKN